MDVEEEFTEYLVLNNWRAAHGFPLNGLTMALRQYARRVDDGALVAQRLKRLESITQKLEREPSMQLTTMQDIGGCRAVVETIEHVYEVRDAFVLGRTQHDLLRQSDYIAEPKPDGYRSVHLAYAYKARKDSRAAFDGLRIEVQIRTRLQHAWATAVETIDTIMGLSLKTGAGEGEPEWIAFFRLMSAVFAHIEGTAPVPAAPTDLDELRRQVRLLESSLDVVTRLQGFSRALVQVEERASPRDRRYILELDRNAKTVKVHGFREHQLDEASSLLAERERAAMVPGASLDVVQVSVPSIVALRLAFPNYFGDTERFIKVLKDFLERTVPAAR